MPSSSTMPSRVEDLKVVSLLKRSMVGDFELGCLVFRFSGFVIFVIVRRFRISELLWFCFILLTGTLHRHRIKLTEFQSLLEIDKAVGRLKAYCSSHEFPTNWIRTRFEYYETTSNLKLANSKN